jgi:hypothetical protein
MTGWVNRFESQKWIRIAFINLLIVALLGVIMRYKIAYYLPFIQQENFLHAHSHFAFSGWLSQVIMVLMVISLYDHLPGLAIKKYTWLITANVLVVYVMLLSFMWQGYGAVSLTALMITFIISYLFAIAYWKDLSKIKGLVISSWWFKSALLFNVISSFGAFFISYITANKISHPTWFLAGTYFFLHFQYNGWFFFACMGLLSNRITAVGISYSLQKKIFLLFVTACIPAYFLSALWLPIPLWVYILVVLAALAQVAGLILLLKTIYYNRSIFFKDVNPGTRLILILSAVALTIKLLLQAGSTIPYLSKIAFGFRPVVIGYLHLVLLGVLTLFIIGYSKLKDLVITNRTGSTGIFIFIAGIILNELLLMIQGISYMNNISVPLINEFLLGAAVIMFSGVLLFNFGLHTRTDSLFGNTKPAVKMN